MESAHYQQIAADALEDKPPARDMARQILQGDGNSLPELISHAYKVRKSFRGNVVTIHIINNGQNGFCPEDCHYCAQAKSSAADIHEYPLKSDEEFLAEARNAYEKGAHRYCMVFGGWSGWPG